MSFRGHSRSTDSAGQCCCHGCPPHPLPGTRQVGPQQPPPHCLPGHRNTAAGPASIPSLPAGSTRHWLTTGTAQPPGRGQGCQGWWGLGSPEPPSPCSPSNGSSQKLSVDELYLSDTGGQYLCVALSMEAPAPPHAPSAGWHQGVPKPALGLHRTPVHVPPLQGRDDRHHPDGALGCAHPTPEGTSPSHASQHTPVVPSMPLQCPVTRSQTGLDVPGGHLGTTTLSPSAMPFIGSLHPRADGQHRPVPPRLPTQHGGWVLSRALGSPVLPRPLGTGRRRAGGASVARWPPPHLVIPQGEPWSPSPAGHSGMWDSTMATGPATASATSSRSMSVGAATPAPAQGRGLGCAGQGQGQELLRCFSQPS